METNGQNTSNVPSEIAWCCNACDAAGHIEPGHFACSMPDIPAGWHVVSSGYGDGGWSATIEPARPDGAPCTLLAL